MHDFLGPDSPLDSPTTAKRQPRSLNSSIIFSNPAASQFYVDGTSIPDVKFDAGPSWSGLMPISSDPNETRKLFFWFWPSNNASNTEDLIFWTNGGPGCSSLEGFLQENGPISWSWGQSEPTLNPWSWTNLSHVLWVEQPVGTGFTQGTPNITNDDELAEQFAGFLGQFLEVFSELKGKNFYATGESYAGYYVPYIANWIYEHPGSVDLDLKGVWISDATLTLDVVQGEIPALRFVQNNRNVFPFNSSFMAHLQNISDACGYTDYIDKYVKYPPTGPLPLPIGVNQSSTATSPCSIREQIQMEIGVLNPAFNVYRVTQQWPVPWSVTGFPGAQQGTLYFNRTDVQDAIHAPHTSWDICNFNGSVYANASGPTTDSSPPAMLSVLPNVIEKSARSVILHGVADFEILAEGIRAGIQNMTWGGAQGFQKPIEPESFHVKNMGVYGETHTERNLTYVEFYFSGHMTPQFVPWAAYQTVAYLLGKQDTPST
ncbi:hypothetical protein PLICRDRAFT_114108 [Plicaturopsis crispa FD-325 SS-3]|nr:hypothetical protein PLICRDRAFT_114108 [Plicaturopsis crispa FD-325 SS-3]